MAYKRISPIPVAEGGTGAITLTDHGILVGSGTSAIDAITMTDGQLLIGKTGAFDPVPASLASAGSTIAITPGAGSINLETGSAIAASFPTDAGTATPAAGALTVAGGTNIASAGAGSTVTLNLDAALTGITSVTVANGGELRTGTTAGDTLLLRAYDNTGASYTTFGTLTANLTPTFNLNTATTINSAYIYRAGGTDVPVADGGTGASTLAAHGILLGQGTSAITSQTLTDGQLLIGKTGAFDPVAATLTAGAGISITPGAGSITIASTVTGLTWALTTVDAALVAGNGYIANKAGLLTMTLPATGAIGDIIEITNMNTAVGWRIAQNANQYIRLGSSLTTVGVGGYLEATQLGDSVKLVCNVAGASTGWVCVSALGNITVV